MDELVANPDGCTRFEPNQFKKEKCKNCGRQWTEHKGVITQELINTFVRQKQKIIDDQKLKEAEAQEKARAKALAKKAQNQAPEDAWFFDGQKAGPEDAEDDSDGDLGFQMLRPEDFGSARIQMPKVDDKPSKLTVKNLIDFSACDVTEDRSSDGGGSAVALRPLEQEPVLPGCPALSGPPLHHSGIGEQVASSNGLPDAGCADRESMTLAPSMFIDAGRPEKALQEELLGEIEHLRQMLADANEEKSIQVAIVRDEVVEKQQLLDDLSRQRVEMEKQLRETRERLAAAEARGAQAAGERDEARALADRARAEAELHCAEAREARAEVEQQRTELSQLQALALPPPAATVASTPMQVSSSIASLLTELRELCSRTQELLGDAVPVEQARPAAPRATADVCELEAELQSLRAMVVANHAAAQHAGAEHKQLAVKFRDLEKVSTLAKRGIASEATARNSAVASEEAHVVAQEVGRQAAQAIKELRLSAEQHLAWVNKKMRKSHQAAAPLGARSTAQLPP